MLESASLPKASLLVTDLDNTLWDWFQPWFNSFDTLLSGLARQSGVSREVLEIEARAVHQRARTSEYSWLIEELPSIRRFCGNENPRTVFASVIHDQNRARLSSIRLYDGVLETLHALREYGVPIIAYTESQSYWTAWRMSKLGLDGVIDCLYSSHDHDAPDFLDVEGVRFNRQQDFHLEKTEHRFVASGLTKPNSQILGQIAQEFGIEAGRIAYVGDSLTKDVAMAQSFGARDVHAKYGEVHRAPEYEQLRRVSHWTAEEIERERDSQPGVQPIPSIELCRGLDEILQQIEFE